MPVIACPGCGEQYKLPATAAGQVAKCACGKRFRLGPARATKPSASPVSSKPKTASAAPAASRPKPRRTDPVEAVAASDAFWVDVLGEESAAKPVAASAPAASGESTPAVRVPNQVAKPAVPQRENRLKKPQKRKEKKVRWGFQWEKVVGGGVTFLIAGGITLVGILATGYISLWIVGIAVVGLFTMLSGLMGEEGIW